ncbi:MAG TPA: alpha-L-rhamnosidase C-terminal domain-containing protein [Acidobacteriaceae bacterium]|nr:alpha-L-rhamnosidase C-terminal domain-containing protein [Acidobacteriaceae bacterium]
MLNLLFIDRRLRPVTLACAAALCLTAVRGAQAEASTTPAPQFSVPDPPPLLLGSAWYPEQWPESRWEADLELMQKANMHLVNTRTMPSWKFMAENGTTFWESFSAVNGNLSLCHWTHSGVGEWLWRNVAGLAPDAEDPGYRSVTIRPRPTKEVSSCRASYLSIRGAIEIECRCEAVNFGLTLQCR